MKGAATSTYACLDIGSNSVLLLLAAAGPDGGLVELEEHFRVTRLGAGVDAGGQLSPEPVAATLAAIGDFMAAARRCPWRPLHWAVAATSAVRDAGNRELFLAPCRQLCGCEPRPLDGDEEADTIYAGAASDQSAERPTVVVDVGGGSTELAVGRGGRCAFRTSLNMGCVRFGERFGLFERPSPAALAAARQAVRDLLEPIQPKMRQAIGDGRQANWLGSGGTATTLAAIHLRLTTYDRQQVHGCPLTAGQAAELGERLAQLPIAQRQLLPGLEAGRAKVLPAGLIILAECLQAFAVDHFRATTRGLRFGLAVRLQRGELPPQATWP